MRDCNDRATPTPCRLRQELMSQLPRRHLQRNPLLHRQRLHLTAPGVKWQIQSGGRLFHEPLIRIAGPPAQLMIEVRHEEFPVVRRREFVQHYEQPHRIHPAGHRHENPFARAKQLSRANTLLDLLPQFVHVLMLMIFKGRNRFKRFAAAIATPYASPMNATPLQLVQAIYQAFATRDLPKIFSLFAPDIEITQSSELPWGGVYHGHDSARQFFTKLTTHLNSTLELERWINAGDQVVTLGWTTGTVNATNTKYRVPIAHVWQIRAGQVQRVQFLIDNPTMLAALAAGK